jgi:3-hydroxybutyryl-CoA dehydratase
MIFAEGDIFTADFKVSNEVYNGFLSTFKDHNPLHTDENFAIGKGFTGMVMHGNILNGFLSYFIGECLPTKDVIIHSQEIQFKNAVFVEDTLAFKAIVSGVYESVNAVEFKFTFLNAAGKTAAKGKIQIGII